MADDRDRLRPATPDEVAQTLAFALRYNGRRRDHRSDELMANIVAGVLVRHLEQSGFVVMKKPPAPMHAAPPYRRPQAD